ncbi:hypothetical protein [Paraburkholderia caledonica]|jgi:hypothetical protein|uniref:hypothetical protein n=1 Tax=Paraburkholderia caledonica TaxID=134536 RepID=UPI000B3FD126|nr:hypothetical protein [Paraburkholderia caledonica]
MTTVSAQTRAAQAGASTETSAANRANHDASHTQAVRFSAVYKNNVTFAHAHHSHHLAQANSAKARQLAAALRKRQAAARAAGKRFAPSQRAASTAHGAPKGAHATSAKTARSKVQADRVTRDGGRQGGGGGGGQPQQEGGQQNGKQRDDHDSAPGGIFAATAVEGVSAITLPRSSAARGGEIRAAIGEALLKLRDDIAAGNVPSADRALQSLMQRIHMLRAAEGALAPSTSAARRELLARVSQRLAQTALDAARTADSTQQLDARGAPSGHGSTAGLAQRVNLLANLVLLVLERPNTPDQAERARHLNAALLGAIEARLRTASRA